MKYVYADDFTYWKKSPTPAVQTDHKMKLNFNILLWLFCCFNEVVILVYILLYFLYFIIFFLRGKNGEKFFPYDFLRVK